MRRMGVMVLALGLVTVSPPAFAYDACGNPPETPSLPSKAATASESAARQAADDNQAYALDTEGYLVCVQLAQSDVAAEAERGDRTATSAQELRKAFEDSAAEARGKQSGWRDAYDRWSKAWSRAHGKPMPQPTDD